MELAQAVVSFALCWDLYGVYNIRWWWMSFILH